MAVKVCKNIVDCSATCVRFCGVGLIANNEKIAFAKQKISHSIKYRANDDGSFGQIESLNIPVATKLAKVLDYR